MNTDGEWNDGRQARFVPTYADYFAATNKLEYLERAVAACRSAFALMDMPENHANGINAVAMPQAPGLGYAPENVHHAGRGTPYGWTGMNWSSGGALAASAYLERHFGSVWVDGATRTATAIDGAVATVEEWQGSEVRLRVRCALSNLLSPYRQPRQVLVRFGRLPDECYAVAINGGPTRQWTRQKMENGITIDL